MVLPKLQYCRVISRLCDSGVICGRLFDISSPYDAVDRHFCNFFPPCDRDLRIDSGNVYWEDTMPRRMGLPVPVLPLFARSWMPAMTLAADGPPHNPFICQGCQAVVGDVELVCFVFGLVGPHFWWSSSSSSSSSAVVVVVVVITMVGERQKREQILRTHKMGTMDFVLVFVQTFWDFKKFLLQCYKCNFPEFLFQIKSTIKTKECVFTDKNNINFTNWNHNTDKNLINRIVSNANFL